MTAGLHDEVVPFTAADGAAGNVLHVVRAGAASVPGKGPVLLVHGAGVRANIFRAAVPVTVVDALLDDGFDVWLENWRASIDLPPSQRTLDDAAVFDHPAAVAAVLEHTGGDSLKAVVHCQGSTSFMMAAAAGLLPEVTTIVSNAVSLHPVIPPLAKLKLDWFHRPVRALTRYLDPHWGVEAPDVIAAALTGWVRLTHRECANTVCRLSSFTYGVGHSLANTPLWLFKRVITVHPLGGVPMGADPGQGVVDGWGESFAYPGLHVVDGSVMPGPVGANPSLTIAAFAERAAAHIIGE